MAGVIAGIVYCGVCSLPPEFCEFSNKASKCKAWLEEHHPHLYERLYSDALSKNLSSMTLEQKESLEKDVAKKEAREEARAERENARLASSKVQIKRIERTKRKSVTTVNGLEVFDIDLKKAAKLFASKFATGASVSKNPQGNDEIVIQGDVSDEVADMLTDEDDKKAFAVLGGRVGDSQIAFLEDKKKGN